MIIATIALIVIALIALWVCDGIFSARMDKRDQNLQDYYDDIDKDNHKID